MLPNILHRDNEHLFLEKSNNENNSFIGNVNKIANDLENVNKVANNLEYVKEAINASDYIREKYDEIEAKANQVSQDAAKVQENTQQSIDSANRAYSSEVNAKFSEDLAKESLNLCLDYAKQAQESFEKIKYSYEDLIKYAKLAEDKANEADHHAQDAAYNANLATDRATDALNSVAKVRLSESNAHRDSLLAENILRDVSAIRTELMKLVVSIASTEKELREKADSFVNRIDFYNFIAEITHTNIQQSQKFYLLLQKLTELELSHSEDISEINNTNLDQSIRISNNTTTIVENISKPTSGLGFDPD